MSTSALFPHVFHSPLLKTYLSKKPREGAEWPAVGWLMAFMLLSSFYWQDYWGLGSWLTASREQVIGGHEYWRLFTTIGVHGDLKHFLSNSFFFVGLAFMLNGYFGAVAFPLLSLLAGAATNWLTLWTYPSGATLVGASGVVYFMASFWLMLYVLIERRLTLPRRFLMAAGLTAALLLPQSFEPGVSYGAHAIGYAMGVVTGGGYFLTQKEKLRSAEKYAPVPEILTLEPGMDYRELPEAGSPRSSEFDFEREPPA